MLILDEINVVVFDVLVYVLYFYDCVWLNKVVFWVFGIDCYFYELFVFGWFEWDDDGNLMGFVFVCFNV